MADRWTTLPIVCGGGLHLEMDTLTQGTKFPGTAVVLQNYEPALEGGYKRLLGFQKFDDIEVPGDTDAPVLGVKVALDGVIACRLHTGSYDLHFSAGAGWTKINSAARNNLVNKMRGVQSSITTPAAILLDGANPALKWDGTIDTLINGVGAPADPKYGAIYKNRLVLAGYSSDPQSISISEPNTDIGFDGASGAQELPCSDDIVGLRTFRGELYIYCLNSIKKLTGSTSLDFEIVDITVSIGCVSGDTIQELGGDLIFLAPDGFRSTSATQRIGDVELSLLSRAIQPLIRNELSKALDPDKYSSLPVRAKSQYRLFVNQSPLPAVDQIGFIGKLGGRNDDSGNIAYDWSTIRGIQPYCADSAYTNDQEYCIIGSNSNGYVYRLEQGTSFDGESITAIYRSPDITIQDSTLRKVLQKAEIFTQVEGDVSVTFRTYIDRSATGIPQPASQTLAESGTQTTYGTGLYGTAIYGNLVYPVFKRNLLGSGFTFSFEFTSVGTDPSHRIDAFNIIFAQKGFR